MEHIICENITLKDISEEEFRQKTEEDQASSDLMELVTHIDRNTQKEDLETMLQTLNEALKKLERSVRAFGLYEGNVYIGYIALADYESDTPEIQIELAESHRHRGIGHQALRLVIGEVFQNTNADFLIYRAHCENIASIALIKKCGGILIRENPFLDSIISKYHIYRPFH